MIYLRQLSNSLLKWSNLNPKSSTIILPVVRDFLILEEIKLIKSAMKKMANSNIEPSNVQDLMYTLKDTNRDLHDILQNIEFLQGKCQEDDSPTQETNEITKIAISRLCSLQKEAEAINDVQLSREIKKFIDAVLN